MKKTILFVLTLILLASCSEDPNKVKFTFTGKINNLSLNGKYVIVEDVKNDKTAKSDTIMITNNSFELKGGVPEVTIRSVYMENNEIKPFQIALENGVISAEIEPNKVKISGTPLNDLFQKFSDSQEVYATKINETNFEMTAKEGAGQLTPELKTEYGNKFRSITTENNDSVVSFIRQNVNNPVGSYLFFRYYMLVGPELQQKMISFASEDIKKVLNNAQ